MVVSKQFSPWIVAFILCITACLDGPTPSPSTPPGSGPSHQVAVLASQPDRGPLGEVTENRDKEGSNGLSPQGGGSDDTDEANALSISASYCEFAGCPLRIHFGRKMVADKDGSRLPTLTFEPPQSGTLEWENSQTLRFTPAKGSFNWGHSITAILEGADAVDGTAMESAWVHSFTVPFFGVGNKMALWPVQAGQPRFVGIMRGTEGALMGSAPLLLLYDQPVEPSQLGGLMAIRGEDGKSIPVKTSRPQSAQRFGLPDLDPAHLIAVNLTAKVPDGTILALDVPTWRQAGKHSVQTTEVEVATNFEIRQLELPEGWNEKRAPMNFQFSFNFSTPVRAEELKNALEISPKPESLWTWGDYGTSVSVSLQLAPGKRYTVRLAKGFTDILGNSLRKGIKKSFRTRDLRPRAALGEQGVVYPRKGASIPLKGTNLASIEAEKFSVDTVADYIRFIEKGKPCDAPATRGRFLQRTKISNPTSLNREKVLDVPIRPRDKRGFVCVVTRAHGLGTEAKGTVTNRTVVQLTDLGITSKVAQDETLVWVTQQNTAKPLPRTKVSLYDRNGTRLAKVVTDRNGLARIPVPAASIIPKRHYIVAETGHDTAVTPVKHANMSRAWQFGLRQSIAGHRTLSASLFTERGVYRPGETVHSKFIVRNHESLAPEKGQNVTVELVDSRGDEVFKKDIVLDDFGSGSVSLDLKKDARVGRYTLWLRSAQGATKTTFQVEEYRVPTFAVKVNVVNKKDWGSDTSRVRISARYLRGGRLAGRSTKIRIVRTAEHLRPKGFEEYTFADPRTQSDLEILVDRELTLDGEGQAIVEFSSKQPSNSGPMRYSIEASVTDLDQQTYSGKLTHVVHLAKTYVGVKSPPRTIVKSGQDVVVPVVAVDRQGNYVSGQRIRVQLVQVENFTVKQMGSSGGHLLHSEGTNVIKRCSLRSQKKPVNCRFSIPQSGRYRVLAQALPYPAEKTTAGFHLTAYGWARTEWKRFEHERIKVHTDKDEYRAGDVAQLVVESPFPNAQGLVTIEREGVIDEKLFRIRGDTPKISIPIKDSWAPNVFVSVVLLSPRIHTKKDATGTETGAPAFRIGYANLRVQPRNSRATVAVSFSEPQVKPGEEVDLTIQVRDEKGQGSSGQATVWLVDEAVLGLTRFKTPSPISAVLAPHTLGIRTASSYLDFRWARKARNETIRPAGDGEEDDYDEANEAPRPPLDVRSLMQSTAYWNPNLSVSKDGTARVRIKLPDNLTKWRAMVVFTGRNRLIGSGETHLVTSKPLMVEASLPRFAYPNDTFIAGATVVNASKERGASEIHIAGHGFELKTKQIQKTDPLGHGASVRVPLPMTVKGSGTLELQLAASLKNFQDGLSSSIPILEPGSTRTKVHTRAIDRTGSLSVSVPADRVPRSGQLEVTVSTTVLSKLREAVGYLMDYPYGCIEQTTSRAYPLVVLDDLLPDMGVEVDETTRREYAEAGIQRLLSFQTPSGGLSYWPGGRTPHAFGTGFGLTALLAAKKRGYDVPDGVLARISDYLVAVLNREGNGGRPLGGEFADADTKAFLVMQLGRLDRHQPGLIAKLWEDKASLSGFGLAFLSTAAREMRGSESLVQPILTALQEHLTVTEDEAFVDATPKGGWSMDSPIRTHAASLLAFTAAGGQESLKQRLLNGLLNRTRRGRWGNTQENVFGIMAIAESVASQKAPSGSEARLTLNGKPISWSRFESVSPRLRRLTLPLHSLDVKQGEGAVLRFKLEHESESPLYLTTRLTYRETLSDATRAPVSRGMSMTRQILALDGKRISPKHVNVGDIVRMRLRVSTDERRNYVAIDDRLPAGFEALNASLATTETVGSQPLTKEGRRGLRFLSHHELRDERAVFFVDEMPRGVMEFEYLVRATTRGTFTRPAGSVVTMYDPAVSARTAIDKVVVL